MQGLKVVERKGLPGLCALISLVWAWALIQPLPVYDPGLCQRAMLIAVNSQRLKNQGSVGSNSATGWNPRSLCWPGWQV